MQPEKHAASSFLTSVSWIRTCYCPQ